jgi:hypothetical protein
MTTTPRLIEHSVNFIDLALRNRAGVQAYRIGAANTLDTAFAGTTAMFTVRKGRSFRSITLRRNNRGRTQESQRGLTRVMYDPEDYAGGVIPHDNKATYLRVEEQNAAGVFLPEGPILIVPPPGFFNTGRPSLTVRGTAPAVAPSADETPPVGALHFVLPRFSDHVTIHNEGGVPLMVAFDDGLPEISIPTGAPQGLFDGTYSEVYVRGDGGAPAFSMYFSICNGELA